MAGEIFGGLMGAGSSGNPNFYIGYIKNNSVSQKTTHKVSFYELNLSYL